MAKKKKKVQIKLTENCKKEKKPKWLCERVNLLKKQDMHEGKSKGRKSW